MPFYAAQVMAINAARLHSAIPTACIHYGPREVMFLFDHDIPTFMPSCFIKPEKGSIHTLRNVPKLCKICGGQDVILCDAGEDFLFLKPARARVVTASVTTT